MRHYGRVVVSLAAAACMLFGGATNANASAGRTDIPIALSNVHVERSGERTASVSFDYTINEKELDAITGVCLSLIHI